MTNERKRLIAENDELRTANGDMRMALDCCRTDRANLIQANGEMVDRIRELDAQIAQLGKTRIETDD